MIKHLNKFTVKHKDKDALFLIKNLKKISTGIDFVGNKHVNYFIAIKYSVTMRQ